jgi:hypothetical protein
MPNFQLGSFDDILYRSGLRERLRSEGFACPHHGPYDSRELVRKRHGHAAHELKIRLPSPLRYLVELIEMNFRENNGRMLVQYPPRPRHRQESLAGLASFAVPPRLRGE